MQYVEILSFYDALAPTLAPVRRIDDRTLSDIPPEIYLCIFDHLASSQTNLTEDEIDIFFKLAAVCKLFAQITLPRIFRYAHFSGPMVESKATAHLNDLCRAIIAGQSLAPVMALCIRECSFTNFQMPEAFDWGLSMYSELYGAGTVYMKNIRQLKFHHSFVRREHWAAIVALERLEELIFDSCEIYEGPSPYPDGRVPQFRVPRLEVYRCLGVDCIVPSMDTSSLRLLKVEIDLAKRIVWHREAILEELFIDALGDYLDNDRQIPNSRLTRAMLPIILRGIPPSVTVLSVRLLGEEVEMRRLATSFLHVVELHELTFEIRAHRSDLPAKKVLDWIREDCGRHEGVQSFVIKLLGREYPPPENREVRSLIRHSISITFPNVKFVEIYGKALRLAESGWVNASGRSK